MIGQLLDGRYQIISTLGAGGFGQTFRAEDQRRPGCPICVVKHLKPASSDPKFLETARRLFHEEAETLEKLGRQHDQIPRLLAFFEQEQEFYLAQELIEGQPLSTELLPGKVWTEQQIIHLLEEVLRILQFVHEQGVIHRDIKPDNIIRRQADQKLFLVDFGAVKQVRTQMATVQGQISATIAVGTPGYMPSEQGQGKPRPSSDIYALGIIGIQALTGINPAEFQEDLETGEILWQQQVTVSPGLAEILSKMVKCYFKERYTSATEALQALHQLQSDYTPTQANYTPTQQASETASELPSTTRGTAQTTTQSTTPVGGRRITEAQDANSLQPQQSIPKGLLVVGCLLAAAIFSLGGVMALHRFSPMSPLTSGGSPSPSSDPAKPTQDSSPQSAQGLGAAGNASTNSNRPIASGQATAPTRPSRPPTPAGKPKPPPPNPSGQSAQSTPVTPVPEPPAVDQGMIRLDEAWVQADGGNLDNAIAIAQAIPSSSSAYAEAQNLIQSWQAALNQPAQSNSSVECSAYASGSVSQLSDLSPTNSYFQAVQTAVEAWGVLGGCSDGTFRGNSAATQSDYDAVQTVMTQSGLDAHCVYNYLSGGQTRYQLASAVVQIQQSCIARNELAPNETVETGPI